MKNKKFLLLGSKPNGSKDIVKYAKSLGAHTIVTDYLESSYDNAKEEADEHWMIDVADRDKLIKKIKEQKIDCVFAGVQDFCILQAMEICKDFNFNFYCTKEQWNSLTDKRKMRTLCEKFEIPVAKGYSVTQVLEDDESVCYPIIVKPANGTGAFGVKICVSRAEVNHAIALAKQFSSTSEVVIEQYIDEKEIKASYVIQGDKIHLAFVADRYIRNDQTGEIPLPVAYSMPSVETARYINTIDKKVRKMFEYLGIKNSYIFLQLKVSNEKFYVYDFGLRLGGAMQYKLLKKTCGYCPMEMMVEYAITGKMGKQDITSLVNPIPRMISGSLYFLCKQGQIANIIGVDRIDEIQGVEGYYQTAFEGDVVEKSYIGTMKQVVLRIFFVSESNAKMGEAMDKAISLIKITSPEGENMLLPTFQTHELYK